MDILLSSGGEAVLDEFNGSHNQERRPFYSLDSILREKNGCVSGMRVPVTLNASPNNSLPAFVCNLTTF